MGQDLAALELRIKRLIVDSLRLEHVAAEAIDSDAPLVGEGLGLDSIDILELAVAVHKEFGVTTDANDERNRETYASVRNLAAFIASRAGSAG
jgi:acyl carrier protein